MKQQVVQNLMSITPNNDKISSINHLKQNPDTDYS